VIKTETEYKLLGLCREMPRSPLFVSGKLKMNYSYIALMLSRLSLAGFLIKKKSNNSNRTEYKLSAKGRTELEKFANNNKSVPSLRAYR